ncbi:MAG: carboxypeptidase-like regulatory domain-containing protein [Acidobacteriota bacterium]
MSERKPPPPPPGPTGTMAGMVTDVEEGGPLPGVTITAVHGPTGESFETISKGDGTWRRGQMRVGGPYEVTAAMVAFKPVTKRVDDLEISRDSVVNFKLELIEAKPKA